MGSQNFAPPWKVIVKTFATEDLSFILQFLKVETTIPMAFYLHLSFHSFVPINYEICNTITIIWIGANLWQWFFSFEKLKKEIF